MSSYTDTLGEVTSTTAGAKRAAEIVAALAPPPPVLGEGDAVNPSAATEKKPSAARAALMLAPGVVGGAVGAVTWKEHRVLGFLAGHAVGDNVYPIFRGNPVDRKKALCNLGVEGAGIGGALLWKKHPVFGWLVGVLVSSAASSFIPGSPVNEAYGKLKIDWNKDK